MMNPRILVILFLFAGLSSAQSGDYSLIVEENGNALVLISLTGAGTVDIPLPLDVSYPQVLNALFVESANGIEVSLDPDEPATIAYKSSMLTTKTQGNWEINMDLGLKEYTVQVSLPKNAVIKTTEPKASYTETSDSKNIVFEKVGGFQINYGFDSKPDIEPTSTTITTNNPTTTTIKKQGDEFSPAYIIIGALGVVIVAILGILIAYFIYRRRFSTSGMQKVMRTLGGNEYKIVDTLLKNKSGMKRSDLERQASISKSSLALALNNLERKNIVEIDRSSTTHYLELTKWFRGL